MKINDYLGKAITATSETTKLYFNEHSQKKPENIVCLYEAMYYFNAIRAIYLSQPTLIENELCDELEIILNLFDKFMQEFVEQYRTKQEFRIAEGYYNQLLEAYENYKQKLIS